MGQFGMPSVVAVTGFLGDPSDFDGVKGSCFKDWSWRVLTPLDLGGGSIVDMASQLQDFPADLRIGYSMGGRVMLAAQDGTPTIALSAGTGLHEADARDRRAQIDDERADELRQDPEAFLKAWYEQPLFGALRTSSVWKDVEARRSAVVQLSEAWATVLAAASPGRTPVPTLEGRLGFVVGNLDQAYRVPPESFPHRVIPRAGHAIHLESPEATALAIQELFKELQS
jgi:pimeloyl-ACP methyl ester carboxylesterase